MLCYWGLGIPNLSSRMWPFRELKNSSKVPWVTTNIYICKLFVLLNVLKGFSKKTIFSSGLKKRKKIL